MPIDQPLDTPLTNNDYNSNIIIIIYNMYIVLYLWNNSMFIINMLSCMYCAVLELTEQYFFILYNSAGYHIGLLIVHLKYIP